MAEAELTVDNISPPACLTDRGLYAIWLAYMASHFTNCASSYDREIHFYVA